MAKDGIAGKIEEYATVDSKPKRGRSGKGLVLLIMVSIVLLAVGGVSVHIGYLLDPSLGMANSKTVAADDTEKFDTAATTTFYELPEMVVNLDSARRTNFLKLVLALELENYDDVAELEKVLPRIVDNLQVYLRQLRIDDLQGSAGTQRLREELLLRVNASTKTAKVRDVLFKEFLVQ
jgi:flagellar FliL protein